MFRRPSGYLRLLAALAALFLALFVTACGGGSGDDGDDGDSAAITAVIVSAVTEDDSEALCNEWISERFVEAVYTDVESCVEAAADDGSDADDATVTDIEVDGDSATATITEIGGDTDGATGSVSLIKVDGNWRVDELSVGYLRSILRQGLAGEADSNDDAAENPFADPEIRTCIEKGMDNLSDEDFREIAYDGLANRDPNETFIGILTDCIPGAS